MYDQLSRQAERSSSSQSDERAILHGRQTVDIACVGRTRSMPRYDRAELSAKQPQCGEPQT